MAERHEDAAENEVSESAQPVAEQAAVGAEIEVTPETLRARLEEEQARADKNLTNWQRAEADLANYRRRAEQERAELLRYGNATLIRKILPVLDDFERAISAIPEGAASEGWLEGIKLIDRKLRTVLEQEGVTPVEALGQVFDPHVHEAVMREESEGNTDVVVEEFQKGYRLHDRVLRPAMVKVGRRDSDQTEQSRHD